MELTPKDRQRIYEEEKARLEAQGQLREEEKRRALEQIHQTGQEIGTKAAPYLLGCIAIFLLIFFLILMLPAGNQTNSSGSSLPSSPVSTVPHDGKTQEQVDKDQEDIRKMNEGVDHYQNDPNFRKEVDKEADRQIEEGKKWEDAREKQDDEA